MKISSSKVLDYYLIIFINSNIHENIILRTFSRACYNPKMYTIQNNGNYKKALF